MDANDFIREIITPIKCLNYWLDRTDWRPRDLVELSRLISNSPKEYKWGEVSKEIEDRTLNISMPIGKSADGKDDVSIELWIDDDLYIGSNIKCSITYINAKACDVKQANEDILIESRVTGAKKLITINEEYFVKANMYINSLISIFLEQISMVGKRDIVEHIENINKFIGLTEVINKSPKEFFSKDILGKIINKFNTDSIIRLYLKIEGRKIKLIVRNPYSTPINEEESYITLEYNNETEKCESYLHTRCRDNKTRVKIDSALFLTDDEGNAMSNVVEFSEMGIHVWNMALNVSKVNADRINKEVNDFVNYVNKLEIEEDMTPKEYKAKELNSEDKSRKARNLESIFHKASVIAGYLSIKKTEGKDDRAKEELRDIIESSDNLSGLVSSQDFFPLCIMLGYNYHNRTVQAITIEKDDAKYYDVYIHRILDKPISPKYFIKAAEYGDKDLLVEVDKYNMFAVCMTSKQIELILDDLKYIIDKLYITDDETGSNK